MGKEKGQSEQGENCFGRTKEDELKGFNLKNENLFNESEIIWRNIKWIMYLSVYDVQGVPEGTTGFRDKAVKVYFA